MSWDRSPNFSVGCSFGPGIDIWRSCRFMGALPGGIPCRIGVNHCVGCDIVQADHAPDGEVAQGVIHGVLVRHHGRNQEEVEEGLGQEEEEAQETTKCICMDGMR